MSKLSGLTLTASGPVIDGVETGEVGAAAGAAAGAPGATGAVAAGAAAAGTVAVVVVAVCARAETAQRETAPMHMARSIIFIWYISCLVIGGQCLLGNCESRPNLSHPVLGVGPLIV